MAAKVFGEMLVREGMLRGESLRQALATQAAMGGRLDTVILDLGMMSETTLLAALGRFHRTRTVTGKELKRTDPEIARMISRRMAERYRVLPFRLEGRTLSVATLDPSDLIVLDEIAMLTGMMVAGFVTLEARLFQALHRLFGTEMSIQVASVTRRIDADEDSGPRPLVGNGRRAADRTGGGVWTPPAARPRSNRPVVTSAEVELELSDEDLEMFPSLRDKAQREEAETGHTGDAPPPPDDDPLATATSALQNAEMRDDIADALLEFCAGRFRRYALFTVRKETVVGWRGGGDNVSEPAMRAVSVPLAEASVFATLAGGTESWLGPLSRLPRNLELVAALGGREPAECLVLPILLRGKTVCFLYADNGPEKVGAAELPVLKRLVGKAGLAFEVCLLKNKIRTT